MAKYSLSALQTFVSPYQSDPFWIGVDVHKRTYHIALLRADHKTFTFTSPASPDGFLEQLRRLDIRRCCLRGWANRFWPGPDADDSRDSRRCRCSEQDPPQCQRRGEDRPA